MARNEGLTFLGSLPVDTELVTLLDAAEKPEAEREQESENSGEGRFEVLERYLKTSSWTLFKDIVAKAISNIDRAEDHSGF